MKKTRRNSKSCHPSEHIAGTNVFTQCPPALNKAAKKALLREIGTFGKAEKKRARQEAEASARGGAAVDAYQRWREQRAQLPEPVEANPDVLAENDGINYLPSKEDGETANLLKEVRQYFSARELQVWNLVMKHNLPQQEAADLLNISRGSLQNYLRRAHKKFRAFMEASK